MMKTTMQKKVRPTRKGMARQARSKLRLRRRTSVLTPTYRMEVAIAARIGDTTQDKKITVIPCSQAAYVILLILRQART